MPGKQGTSKYYISRYYYVHSKVLYTIVVIIVHCFASRLLLVSWTYVSQSSRTTVAKNRILSRISTGFWFSVCLRLDTINTLIRLLLLVVGNLNLRANSNTDPSSPTVCNFLYSRDVPDMMLIDDDDMCTFTMLHG